MMFTHFRHTYDGNLAGRIAEKRRLLRNMSPHESLPKTAIAYTE